MKIKLSDLSIEKRLEMIKIIDDYKDIESFMKCPEKNLRSDEISCFYCSDCLRHAIVKSMLLDKKEKLSDNKKEITLKEKK